MPLLDPVLRVLALDVRDHVVRSLALQVLGQSMVAVLIAKVKGCVAEAICYVDQTTVPERHLHDGLVPVLGPYDYNGVSKLVFTVWVYALLEDLLELADSPVPSKRENVNC